MIPKNIYFYWGSSPMSYLRYASLASFRIVNPDWRIVLYTRKNSVGKTWHSLEEHDSAHYPGPDYAVGLKEIGVETIEVDPERMLGLPSSISDVHLKDLLAWYSLANDGGFVSDMDILYYKPISGLVDDIHAAGADTGLVSYRTNANNGETRLGYMPIAFMCSGGDNKLFSDCLERAKSLYDPTSYFCVGYQAFGGHTFDVLGNAYQQHNLFKIPDETVYPMSVHGAIPLHRSIMMAWNEDIFELFSQRTIGYHWYGGTPESHEFQYQYHRVNNNRPVNTITRILSIVGL